MYMPRSNKYDFEDQPSIELHTQYFLKYTFLRSINTGGTWKINKTQLTKTTEQYNILLHTFQTWSNILEKPTSLHLTTNT
jgi:hypothetical protein